MSAQVSSGLIVFLATSCGLIVANIYYAQQLVSLISQDVGLPATSSGLITTLTQLGYGLGLLLIVPFADLLENRQLVIRLLLLEAIVLLFIGFTHSSHIVLVLSFAVGIGAVGVQVLVPLATQLVDESNRGQVIGRVMSGLMLGIMLARPVSSLIASHFSWRVVFYCSAVVMLILSLMVKIYVPRYQPDNQISYLQLLRSMYRLMRDTQLLRRRAMYHTALFFVFSLFWTITPIYLAAPPYNLSQSGIALFSLAGVAGALAAPLAGVLADRGLIRIGTAVAMLLAALAFLLVKVDFFNPLINLGFLVCSAIILDAGVSANLVFGQRSLYALQPNIRGRLNALYMATFFIGGAFGSWIGVYIYFHGGWSLVTWVGVAIPALILVIYLLTLRSASQE